MRRYNWYSVGSLGWLFPMLKYKYIFQIKCTEAISSNSTRKLLWFEIAKLLIAVRKNYCVICNNFRHTFVPYAISKGLTRVWTGVLVQLKIAAVFLQEIAVDKQNGDLRFHSKSAQDRNAAK